MTSGQTQSPLRLSQILGRRALMRLAATSLVGVLAAAGYLLVTPKWYASTLSVVPSGQNKSPGPLAGALGVLGSATEFPSLDLGMSADVERIAAVLKSTSVTDAVIARFHLLERYDQPYIEHTRKALWKHCSVTIDRKAKLVSLTCEDQDPAFVQELLTYFGEVGNETFRRVSATAASEEVRFLEQRVAETKAATEQAAQVLRAFEEEHKIVDLETQSKAVVSSMASLRGQEISKELELSYLNSFSSSEEVTAQQLRQQLAVLRAKVRALEQTPTPSGAGETAEAPASNPATAGGKADMFPPALTVPQLRYELEKLQRDRKLTEANLVFLMQRLETSKVNQARDTSTFVILDSPALPTYKSRPKRLLVLALGLALGAMLGLAWQFGPTYVRTLLVPATAAPAQRRES